jgi:hypothetical protein
MFELSFIRDRWVIFGYGIGLLLLLIFFLSYLAGKRPRQPELYQSGESPRPISWSESWGYLPWILILTYVGTFVYSVIDIVWKSRYPPNY